LKKDNQKKEKAMKGRITKKKEKMRRKKEIK